MPKKPNQIIADIEDFIAKYDGRPGEWYLGVSCDPKEDLYNTHGFKKGDAGLYRTAWTEREAYDVVEYFIKTRGARGDSGEMAPNDVSVYAYRMNSHTSP